MNYIDLSRVDESSLETLRARTLGTSVPVSIGTALILEHEDANLKLWSPHLYVNMRTLLRNIVQAVPSREYLTVTKEAFVFVLLEEMEALKEFVSQYTGNKTTVFYYYPTYKGISRQLPKANWSPARGGQISEIFTIEENVKKLLEEVHDVHKKETKEELFSICDVDLPRGDKPSMVLTHYTVDLLSARLFPTLFLLESHTGRIKKRPDWNTKLTLPTDDRARIPFCRFTLQVFGDGKAILANSHQVKKVVRELAVKNKWTNITTQDRIRQNINSIPAKIMREQLLELM